MNWEFEKINTSTIMFALAEVLSAGAKECRGYCMNNGMQIQAGVYEKMAEKATEIGNR